MPPLVKAETDQAVDRIDPGIATPHARIRHVPETHLKAERQAGPEFVLQAAAELRRELQPGTQILLPEIGVEGALATVGDGHHNAGPDCQGGCHDHGFTVSGTLYTSPAGIAPMVGATITLVDANNKSVDAVTQKNGNFYTTELLVFPVMTRASLCPDHVDMNAKIAAKSGCNAVGCHTANVGQGPIHLP